jgi:hypothetical protein
MESISKRKLIAAFTLGYFVSFLRDQLDDVQTDFNKFSNYMLTDFSDDIIRTAYELVFDIFDEAESNNLSLDCTNDPRQSLDKFYEIISEKIQRGGESFLELSFLAGSILSLINSVEPNLLDIKKYELIFSDLCGLLGRNVSWHQLNSLFKHLSSNDSMNRRDSRNELFAMISGNLSNHNKIFEIQKTLENKITYDFYSCA